MRGQLIYFRTRNGQTDWGVVQRAFYSETGEITHYIIREGLSIPVGMVIND